MMNIEIPAAPLAAAEAITEETMSKGILPGLAVVRVGAQPEHIALEKELADKANEFGIVIEKYIMDGKFTEEDVIDVIEVINMDYKVHAVVMPGPLPEYMDEVNVRGFLGDKGKAVSGSADELLYFAAVKAKAYVEELEAMGE